MACLCGGSSERDHKLKFLLEHSPFGVYLDAAALSDLAAAFVRTNFAPDKARAAYGSRHHLACALGVFA